MVNFWDMLIDLWVLWGIFGFFFMFINGEIKLLNLFSNVFENVIVNVFIKKK